MSTTGNQDAELLRRYADTGAEDAFAEVVARHLPLVFSAAVRQLGDADRARDVAQMVFIEVARQATGLRTHPAFTGWLHTTTFRLARRAIRDDRRRERREQEAHAMQELERDPISDVDARHWKAVIDEALQELRDSDRAAVILRHLEGRSLREVGESLGIGEDAARMRVQRALDRLQSVLARKGWVASGSTLAAGLTAHGLEAVPLGLAAEVVAAAASGAATGMAGGAGGTGVFVAMKAPLIASVAVALVVAVPLIYQTNRLRRIEARLDRMDAGPATAEANRAADPDAAARREVERLRSELPELSRLRAEATNLRAHARKPAQATVLAARENLRSVEAEAAALAEEEELRQSREAAIHLLKNLGLAARVFATSHGDRMPERFEDMTEELGGASSPLVLELERYEFFPQPRRVSEAEPQLFLFREKQPRRRPNGGWERVYALADGSVQLIESPTEDFTQVEHQHGGVATLPPDAGGASAPGK